MFELIFLGTSAAAPTIYRGLSSLMIIAEDQRFLIDCGEGTQRQILQSGLGFKRLDKILLTHGHLDHILGLGGLLSTLARWENFSEIEIWGGESVLDRVSKLIYEVVFPNQNPPTQIDLYQLSSGVFFEHKKFTIQSFPVKHQGAGNFGFVFQERTRRPFLAEKAEALNIPSGPERAQLVQGNAVTLADGRTIHPDEVLGEPIEGTKVVVVGDCGDPSNLVDIAANADCLIMEATYTQSENEFAGLFGHMTAAGSAQLAKDANVKTLILNHISRRSREFEIRNEAQAIFPNTLIARDFDHYVISKERLFQKKDDTPSA